MDWLGIRVYEPKRTEGGEVVWHLTPIPPAKLTNVLIIGTYEELARVCYQGYFKAGENV